MRPHKQDCEIRKAHSTTRIGVNTVTKIADPQRMRIEVEKTRRAFAISRDCGLFQVPEVLDYDDASGAAVFQRLDIEPFWRVPWGTKRIELAKQLGVAIAIVHRQLALPGDMRIPLPCEVACGRDESFLHGDLSIANVCVDASHSILSIVDWQMTPLYGGCATRGTRYFDLFWFISNLAFTPQTRFVYSDPVAPVANAFMASYFEEARLPCDSHALAAYAGQLFGVVGPRLVSDIYRLSKGRARLLVPFCQALATKFVRSLGATSVAGHEVSMPYVAH